MWLFIRRIDHTTTRKELARFVAAGLRRHWLFVPLPSKARVKRCEILRITDPETRQQEFHGLVDIEPASAALAAIEQLDGREWQGRRVHVHKFFRRSYQRDRRQGFSQRSDHPGQERRQRDRRRPDLHSSVVHAPHIERTLGFGQA